MLLLPSSAVLSYVFISIPLIKKIPWTPTSLFYFLWRSLTICNNNGLEIPSRLDDDDEKGEEEKNIVISELPQIFHLYETIRKQLLWLTIIFGLTVLSNLTNWRCVQSVWGFWWMPRTMKSDEDLRVLSRKKSDVCALRRATFCLIINIKRANERECGAELTCESECCYQVLPYRSFVLFTVLYQP